MLGQEQKTRFRQQVAIAITAIARIEEQRAKFAVAGVIVAQEQRLGLREYVQLLRGMHRQADAVRIPRLTQSDCCREATNADHLPRSGIFEHEQE